MFKKIICFAISSMLCVLMKCSIYDTRLFNHHGIKPQIVISVFYPEKNTLLAVIPRLSTEWSISFELHPLYGVVVQPDKLCNIFHLTIGGAWGDFGDRIPAVFMKNNEISVASAINNNPNFSPSLGIRLIDKPLKMEINQLYVSGGRYRFFIMNDGQEVLSKLTNATQYYNVKVYGSNPISRCPNVVVRNFQHTNFP